MRAGRRLARKVDRDRETNKPSAKSLAPSKHEVKKRAGLMFNRILLTQGEL